MTYYTIATLLAALFYIDYLRKSRDAVGAIGLQHAARVQCLENVLEGHRKEARADREEMNRLSGIASAAERAEAACHKKVDELKAQLRSRPSADEEKRILNEALEAVKADRDRLNSTLRTRLQKMASPTEAIILEILQSLQKDRDELLRIIKTHVRAEGRGA